MAKKKVLLNEKEVQITAKIHSHFKVNGELAGESDTTEVLDTIRLQDGVPYCTISTDRKFSLQYGSKAASVFCSVPCILNEDEMDKAYAFAANFCETKLNEMMG